MKKSIAFLAAGLFSTGLMAADEQQAATFESLDRDSDQQISQAEAQGNQMVSQAFATADANNDGYLSKAEFQAHEAKESPGEEG